MERRDEYAYLIGLAYPCVSIKWEFLIFLRLLVKITRWRTWIKMTRWTKMTQRSGAWEEMLQPWFLNRHSGNLQESSHRCHLSLLSSSCSLMGTSWKIMRIFSCPLGAMWRGICTDRDHQGGCSSGGATELQCTTGKDPDFLRPCSNWTFKQDDYLSIRKTPWSTTTWFLTVWWDIHDSIIGFRWNAVVYPHYWNAEGPLYIWKNWF